MTEQHLISSSADPGDSYSVQRRTRRSVRSGGGISTEKADRVVTKKTKHREAHISMNWKLLFLLQILYGSVTFSRQSLGLVAPVIFDGEATNIEVGTTYDTMQTVATVAYCLGKFFWGFFGSSNGGITVLFPTLLITLM